MEKMKEDDRKSIGTPLILAVLLIVILVGCLIWFGIKDPELFGKIRDLLVSIGALICFLVGAAISVLFFFLASKIDTAIIKITELLRNADGKIETVADKIAEILKKILDPFVGMKSRAAGIKGIFTRRKAE
ncbi:MAG: hypothetical protein IKP86_11180 [Anaerolineaceae bacterium]|nr:hypothetical protein [Anaerolineaceae bacterium]